MHQTPWEARSTPETVARGTHLILADDRRGGKIGNYLPMIWKRLRLTLEMIKFEHSVFALPFALTGRFTG
jgi:hypothetical protein